MGSSYFYLEFLMAWVTLLETSAGFQNPAIFALEYTLVPDQSYPFQIQQTLSGYKYIYTQVRTSTRVCVSGDSAGGNLVLSLLLHLAKQGSEEFDKQEIEPKLPCPRISALISPWVTLNSTQDHNTASDFLDVDSLHLYAGLYAGGKILVNDPLISPGACKDLDWWRKASPSKGFFISYGAEEVFAPQIRDLIGLLKEARVPVTSQEAKGGIHAWPVASLFLSSTEVKRRQGLQAIVDHISRHI